MDVYSIWIVLDAKVFFVLEKALCVLRIDSWYERAE